MINGKINNKITGNFGEDIATKHLESDGYIITEKNYRVGKIGEIDIIALKNEFICFIEVKTRKSTYFGMPSEAVNRKKQLNIKKIAQIYLKYKSLEDRYIRFDIVEILLDKTNNAKINIIENAF